MRGSSTNNTSPPDRARGVAALLVSALLIAGIVGLISRRGTPPDPRPAATAPAPDPLAAMRPLEKPAGGFAGSESCRECHAENHASWHASYHRTMTQPASPESILASFDNITLGLEGTNGVKRFHLKQNDSFRWVEFLSDHELLAGPEGEPGSFPVVMTTGSHHMQAYWLSVGRDRTMGLLPAVYLVEDQRWIPRRSAFLKAPRNDVSLEAGRWDAGCIRCHATGGRPRVIHESGTTYFNSEASELGISCEACHGGGAEHVRLRRAARDSGDRPTEDPVVNPDHLNARLSSQVCGACHSALIYHDESHVHVPGQTLNTNLVEMMGVNERTRDYLKTFYPKGDRTGVDQLVEMNLYGMFWPDGQMRVVGREYTGMLKSACHSRGELSCVSCHKLHKTSKDPRSLKEWADDQLHEGMRGDSACTQCHSPEKFAAIGHTHHAASSTGSRCMNCHMPHTSYGLLKAARSHTISSPGVTETLTAQRPNACNLCHLDKTLSWTAGHLEDWYDIKAPALPAPWIDTSAAVIAALRGDASVRALLAWHLGWEPAVKASGGPSWIPPLLTVLMDDPYDAIRYIAGRSLGQIDGYQDVRFDFIAPPPIRAEGIRLTLERWRTLAPPGKGNHTGTLIQPDGEVDHALVEALLAGRDNRPVSIHE